MQLRGIPVIAVLIGLIGLAMQAPAAMALHDGDERVARAFLFSGLFTLVVAGVTALALQRPAGSASPRAEIATVLLAWVVLPALAAIPMVLVTHRAGLSAAGFEMVAALTTTGGTIYPAPERLPEAVHLWRGIVAWLGGLIILMAAHAVLAPRNLGGVEVHGTAVVLIGGSGGGLDAAPAGERLRRAWRVIAPVYTGLTASAILLLSLTGQTGLDAAVHGMSLLSTSGISAHRDGLAGSGGFGSEIAAVAFMALAATRLTFDPNRSWPGLASWRRDPEVRLMLALVVLVTLTLFARHWLGVLTIEGDVPAAAGGRALWGAFFTSVSFVTTTGFVSEAWGAARDWSGLENPGLVLLGLCAIGGGAATTAGGVKLIRVAALAGQGMREIGRLSQPMALTRAGPGGGQTRAERREGALIAWAFTMIFLGAVTIGTLALTLTGLSFENGLFAALSGLSNTGPAYGLVGGDPAGFAALGPGARVVMMVLMIVGRVETLALIALFNPDRWR